MMAVLPRRPGSKRTSLASRADVAVSLVRAPADGSSPHTVHLEPEKDVAIIDFSFFDDLELAVLLAQGSTYRLATVSLEDFEHITGPRIPWRRAHQLGGATQAPRACAVNGRTGRRVGCVLGADGRTLEVLDMELADDDEDDADATRNLAQVADGDEDMSDLENTMEE